MHRLTYSVFKVIMLAIIGIFLFENLSYLYRALSINARLDSIGSSLRFIVMDNNYLPEEDANMYRNIILKIINSYNETPATVDVTGKFHIPTSSQNDFIKSFTWNYKSNATGDMAGLDSIERQIKLYKGKTWGFDKRKALNLDMSKPRDYGDIQTIQLKVGVYQPMFGWAKTNSAKEIENSKADHTADNFRLNRLGKSTEFIYTYFVPCLKYKNTNQF